MARISKLVVKESVKEIETLMKKQSSYKNIQRLQALIHIQENTFSTRAALSEHMGVSRRSLEKWLAKYRQLGMVGMLISPNRSKGSSIIPADVDKELSEIVGDPKKGFNSYVEAQQWLSVEHNLDVKYNTVREHLIRRYQTKIKSPRKSHIKKDDQAVDAFLKTP